DLRPRVEMLPVVAVADAQVSVVEDHRVDPRRSESLCVGRHYNFAHIAPAAGKHDRRPSPASFRLVEPGAYDRAFRLKFDVEPFHGYSAPLSAHSRFERPPLCQCSDREHTSPPRVAK